MLKLVRNLTPSELEEARTLISQGASVRALASVMSLTRHAAHSLHKQFRVQEPDTATPSTEPAQPEPELTSLQAKFAQLRAGRAAQGAA